MILLLQFEFGIYPEEMMEAWKVAAAVGNVRNDDASLIVPLLT